MIERKVVAGHIVYFFDSVYHSSNGPAVVNPKSGAWAWYFHGQMHRYYGPPSWRSHLWCIHGRCFIK